ncbi:MAG: hypothetical protein ACLQHS_10980, partial [Candidatus Limnocylindrales bacterium]
MAKASWRLKLDRAEEHLQQLEAEVARYAARNPYQVLGQIKTEGQERIWLYRLQVTKQPDADTLAAMAGDVVHNVRSSLDHIAVALGRRGAFFPVFTENPALDQRTYSCVHDDPRARWSRAVDGMPQDAVTIIEAAQPYHSGPDAKINGLALLNRFDNADKHRHALAPIVSGLRNAVFVATARGQRLTGSAGPGFYEDGAQIAGFVDPFTPPLDESEVHVQVYGAVEVALHVEDPEGFLATEELR